MTWQPIETAPRELIPLKKSGHPVLVSADGSYYIAYWGAFHGWTLWDTGETLYHTPTHWMPLPDPPSEGL